jgi:hypothetical protein
MMSRVSATDRPFSPAARFTSFVGDVGLAHLQMRVHAATRKAHDLNSVCYCCLQVAAEPLKGVRQATLASFLGRTSYQLRVLAADALSRATEGAVAAHEAEHLR